LQDNDDDYHQQQEQKSSYSSNILQARYQSDTNSSSTIPFSLSIINGEALSILINENDRNNDDDHINQQNNYDDSDDEYFWYDSDDYDDYYNKNQQNNNDDHKIQRNNNNENQRNNDDKNHAELVSEVSHLFTELTYLIQDSLSAFQEMNKSNDQLNTTDNTEPLSDNSFDSDYSFDSENIIKNQPTHDDYLFEPENPPNELLSKIVNTSKHEETTDTESNPNN